MFVTGKRNIYSFLSNAIIEQLKLDSINDINALLVKESNTKTPLLQNAATGSNTSYRSNSMPTSLLNVSLVNVNCGNNNGECLSCLLKNGVAEDEISDRMNKVRKENCFGVCSCSIENVDMNNTLLFSSNHVVNDVTDSFVERVKKTMHSQILDASSQMTSTSTKRWGWAGAIFGGAALGALGALTVATGGAAGAALAGGVAGAEVGGAAAVLGDLFGKDTTNTLNSHFEKLITDVSWNYQQSINQLLVTTQVMKIKGTGIKVRNISIQNLQNAVLTAIETNCANNYDSCAISSLNTITSRVLSGKNGLVNNINTTFEGSFKYAFKKNKSLIWGTAIFIIMTGLIYVFLLFKRAAT